MTSKHRCVSILCLALVLGACTTSASTAPSAASSPVAVATLTATAIVATPIPSTAASPAGSSASPAGGGGQPPPNSIDPCSLLTTEEASTLMGKKLGAGVSSIVGLDRVCTFKSGLTEVKLFLAPPASDATTAQKYWDAERAKAPPEIKINDFTLFDRAAYGSGSANGESISALFVIKGTSFFDLFCGLPSCTETASATAGQLIGDRLP